MAILFCFFVFGSNWIMSDALRGIFLGGMLPNCRSFFSSGVYSISSGGCTRFFVWGGFPTKNNQFVVESLVYHRAV